MHWTISLTCAALLPLALRAQATLTTTFANNSGGANGGVVYFDLDVTDPQGVQIFRLDIHTPSPFGGVTFYTAPSTWVGNNNNVTAWTPRAVGAFTTGAGIGAPTAVCFGAGFHLPQGQYGVAIAQDPTTTQAYTVGTGGVPLVFANGEMTLTAGAASNTQFVGPLFVPRIWNGTIHYNVGTAPGGCVPVATNERYGSGCLADHASVYEWTTSAGFDLDFHDLTATTAGGGYLVQAQAGSGPLPVGALGNATVVTLGDDDQAAVGTLGMYVGSNGWLARGGGNTNSYLPAPASLLGNPREAVYAWTDLAPNNSGTVTYEEDPLVGLARVTFDGVHAWGTTDPVFVQIDCDVSTGEWVVRFGAVGFNNPQGWLVGHSPAGPSTDPGTADLSAATITTPASDVPPLAVASDSPHMGGNWTITTSDIDSSSPIAVTFFGGRGVPVPLPSIGLDAPGCAVHLQSVVGNLVGTNVAAVASVSVVVPTSPALVGSRLAAQSVCFTARNAVGLLTSNGVEGTIGL